MGGRHNSTYPNHPRSSNAIDGRSCCVLFGWRSPNAANQREMRCKEVQGVMCTCNTRIWQGGPFSLSRVPCLVKTVLFDRCHFDEMQCRLERASSKNNAAAKEARKKIFICERHDSHVRGRCSERWWLLEVVFEPIKKQNTGLIELEAA